MSTTVPKAPTGAVPAIGVSDSQDYPRLVYTAPYFAQTPLAELIEPSVIEAAEAVLPELVPPYVQGAADAAVDQRAVLLTGSTMSGPLYLNPAIPTQPSQAASMAYVDMQVSTGAVPEVPPVPFGQTWSRQTGAWVPALSDAPADGQYYARQDTSWQRVPQSTVSVAPPTSPNNGALWWDAIGGQLYVYFDDGNSRQWVAASNFSSAMAQGYLALTGGTLTGPVQSVGSDQSQKLSVIDTSTAQFPNTPDTVFRLVYAQQGTEDASKQLTYWYPNHNRSQVGVITAALSRYPGANSNPSGQQSAFYGSAVNYETGVGGNRPPVIVIQTTGLASGHDQSVYGFASQCQDTITPNDDTASAANTNVRLQNEYDWFVHNPNTSIRGNLQLIYSTVTSDSGTNRQANAVGVFGASVTNWDIAYESAHGAAQVGLYIGRTGPWTGGATVPAGLPSQQVQFYYTDTTDGTNTRLATLTAQPLASGCNMQWTSAYAGRVNLQLQNLAALKSQTTTGADVNLIYINGQNNITLGDYTVTNLYLNGSGSVPLPANNTIGFPIVPFVNTPPTGNVFAGALVYDQSNGRLCISQGGGSWVAQSMFIKQSGVSVASPAATGEQNLVSIQLPPLSANASVRITTLWSYPNSANTKGLLMRHSTTSGAITGTLLMNLNNTTTAIATNVVFVRNAGAQNAQKAWLANAFASNGNNAGSLVTGTINTAVASYININASANGTEIVTLESYTVEILVP